MAQPVKRSLSPSSSKATFCGATKKLRNVAVADFDRIVPEVSSNTTPAASSPVDAASSSHSILANLLSSPQESIGKRPKYGDPVDRCKLRKAGNYIIGPIVGSSPLDCLQQRLARKSGTNDFYLLKILTIDDDKANDDRNMAQGQTLLHTENLLLSLIKNMEGVMHAHEYFFDQVFEEKLSDKVDRKPLVHIYTGRILKRVILVLDCVYPHEFDRQSCAFMNLQQYVLKQKLSEAELLNLFLKIVVVVERLHHRNIIHRDLKLNNVVLNRVSNSVILINFCLGKLLSSEESTFNEKRGTPAYIAPELLSGKPYKGKPCDMWSLGVILYTMVVGTFPFMDTHQHQLFKKIKQAEFSFPSDKKISTETRVLIESLLCLSPDQRFTARQAIETIKSILDKQTRQHNDQIVPDVLSTEPSMSSSESSDKPGPSRELSHEQFSRHLELLTAESRENKSFIRPNMLSSRMRPSSVPTTGDSNVAFNLPDGRRTSLTHQIDNLSLHPHVNPDPGAWHTRISGTAATSPAVQSLFLALNELFTRGRLPNPRETREFNGYISHDISSKISTYLRVNCRSQELVREIFSMGRSDRSKVIELFKRFGVQMEGNSHATVVKTEQTINNLMFLTFMMQISGYNNNYFLNIRN